MDLIELGWDSAWDELLPAVSEVEYGVGRVSAEHKHLYRVFTEQGETLAQVSGRYRHDAHSRSDFPVVGDWVVITSGSDNDRAIIWGILPRRNKFSRQTAGENEEEQALVANIDALFIVSSLNRDFNLRRIERYLVLTWESGINPVIVLNKADLCEDVYSKIAEISSIAPGVPVHAISCETGLGLDQLTPYFGMGKTVALLGSSGVGKSTLLNCLLGEPLKRTHSVRSQDDRGRHTTTHRQMHMLPQGGLVIDTPGLRELRLWGTTEGISSTFEDIEGYSARCRFTDCRHQGEPGCAVMEALESGELDWSRYQSYLKLQKEMAYISRKENLFEALEEKEKWKQIHKEIKRIKKR